jgi:hypothetical protein
MSKVVNIQIRGIEKAIQITGDKVELQKDSDSSRTGARKLIITNGGQPVGEFNGDNVDGWWILGGRAKPANEGQVKTGQRRMHSGH